MPPPAGWDARSALARLPIIEWSGIVWRSHGLDIAASLKVGRPVHYEPISDGGSRKRSGRYHRARDQFPEGPVWPALYTSLTDGGCIAEATRHAGALESLGALRITRLRVTLGRAQNLTDPTVIGLSLDDLTDDTDYTIPQEIGLAASVGGIEGLLVPSASRVAPNLVVLTENLLPTSTIEVLDSLDPRLYVRRS